MSIPNRQIGWSNESNLLWYISSELEQIICQAACCTTTSTSSTSSTTTTTTTLSLCAVYSVYSPVKGAYVRYIDCTTGEYVFAGPLDGDATTYYCAKRGSLSFTFGVGTIAEIDVCIPTCLCYLIVNPSLTETLGFGYTTCDGAVGEGTLVAGTSIVVCAREKSVTLQLGLLLSPPQGTCTPTEGCAAPAPESICVTYYVSNNTPGYAGINYIPCGGGEVVTIELPPSSNTNFCAVLGTVSGSAGATVLLTQLGCPA